MEPTGQVAIFDWRPLFLGILGSGNDRNGRPGAIDVVVYDNECGNAD